MTAHPSLPGDLADSAELRDLPHAWEISRAVDIYSSSYLGLSLDTIVDPEGAEHERAVVKPNGAVGVVALDDQDRILLVEQYRHPVRHRMLEIPAGTLDVDGEGSLDTAVRELAEEADLRADEWEPLLTLYSTPGYSTELRQIYCATDLHAVPEAERTPRLAEEADMRQWWVPFDDAIEAIYQGRISDSLTVSAILAVQVQRGR